MKHVLCLVLTTKCRAMLIAWKSKNQNKAKQLCGNTRECVQAPGRSSTSTVLMCRNRYSTALICSLYSFQVIRDIIRGMEIILIKRVLFNLVLPCLPKAVFWFLVLASKRCLCFWNLGHSSWSQWTSWHVWFAAGCEIKIHFQAQIRMSTNTQVFHFLICSLQSLNNYPSKPPN